MKGQMLHGVQSNKTVIVMLKMMVGSWWTGNRRAKGNKEYWELIVDCGGGSMADEVACSSEGTCSSDRLGAGEGEERQHTFDDCRLLGLALDCHRWLVGCRTPQRKQLLGRVGTPGHVLRHWTVDAGADGRLEMDARNARRL